MPQRLKLVKSPQIGAPVFISPHVPEPYSGLEGKITRIYKDKVRVKFGEDFFDEFPRILLMELVENA